MHNVPKSAVKFERVLLCVRVMHVVCRSVCTVERLPIVTRSQATV